jgi:hypothetical protein
MSPLKLIGAALLAAATVTAIGASDVDARGRMVTLRGTTTKATTYRMPLLYPFEQKVYISTEFRVPKGKRGTCKVAVHHYQNGHWKKAVVRGRTSANRWRFASRPQVWTYSSSPYSRSSARMTLKVVVPKGSRCEFRAWAMDPLPAYF